MCTCVCVCCVCACVCVCLLRPSKTHKCISVCKDRLIYSFFKEADLFAVLSGQYYDCTPRLPKTRLPLHLATAPWIHFCLFLGFCLFVCFFSPFINGSLSVCGFGFFFHLSSVDHFLFVCGFCFVLFFHLSSVDPFLFLVFVLFCFFHLSSVDPFLFVFFSPFISGSLSVF